ncbi:Arf GAP with SH3 domain ANK repeat and PH [Fasciolopsis buskii]|uniref:Arf GAP with SH3 domain ANK repeat and PH n=1 Tax=Fasciolopsis buskii TaxID=27845 RepID=A0A8E0S9E7_9TREM|nr:Arf GAP with SH3 domain ANK repeat and PH [Fasciolopsis buski]
MPESLSVDEFINDTLEDVRDPLKANFISKVSSVRQTVHQLDEGIETDRNVLLKTKKLVKSVITSGTGHADNIISLCDYFEKLGQFALESNEINGNDIAASFCKFSVVHRDLANMSKHLMQNMNSILVFPMETFMQGDIKSDLKKPFERALKEYEYKYDKLRKEKLQLMKETGIFTPEAFTAEMTEDLEKERRKLQLETCEYLIKVNELKAKRSADLLQHLIDFYYAQSHYLRECLGVMDHFGKSMNDLANRVTVLQKIHDAQKRRLVDTREEIRAMLEKETPNTNRKSRLFTQSAQAGVTYAAQPTQVNRAYGTRKSGFLLKKSDGKVKRVWQRRRVRIGDDSRTYNFQAEDDQEYEEWISVLNNAMQEEFQRAMNGDVCSVTPDFQQVSGGAATGRNDHTTGQNTNNSAVNLDCNTSVARYPLGSVAPRDESAGGGSLGDSLPGSEHDLLDSSSPTSRSRGSRSSRLGSADALPTDATQSPTFPTELKGRALRAAIQSGLRWRCPGNAVCADCDRADPEWVSVNLGVLICLECCGAHRELGVHCSRTQSLLMDDLSTNQLLVSAVI